MRFNLVDKLYYLLTNIHALAPTGPVSITYAQLEQLLRLALPQSIAPHETKAIVAMNGRTLLLEATGELYFRDLQRSWQ